MEYGLETWNVELLSKFGKEYMSMCNFKVICLTVCSGFECREVQ